MTTYDLCIAWNWPHDADFVRLLEQACRERGLSVLHVTPDNLDAAHQALLAGDLNFHTFMNRAADTDPAFLKLVDWARLNDVFRINPHERETYTADKATMHLELIANGLHTPYSLILAPHNEQPELPELDLSPLGPAFAIKPANGGGGEGVICEATSLEQVAQAAGNSPTTSTCCRPMSPRQRSPASRPGFGSSTAWGRSTPTGGRRKPTSSARCSPTR